MPERYEQVLKVFLVALELEEKGKAFYEKTARESKNLLAQKIFKMLAKDELIHKKRIKVIYQSLNQSGVWDEDWKKLQVDSEAPEKIFKELKKKTAKKLKVGSGDLAALEVGLGLESASINFYQERLAKAEDQAEREFLTQIIKEEKNHHSLLSDMKLFLQDPSTWYLEKEKPGLDGA